MARPIQAFRYPLALNSGLGRIRQESDYNQYIAQLVRQVLLTSPGERINRPDFGAGLRRLIFAPNNPATASLVETVIREALDTWLGAYITTDEVRATSAAERLEVTVAYTVRARQERQVLNMEVTF
jgi:hypothetical protein